VSCYNLRIYRNVYKKTQTATELRVRTIDYIQKLTAAAM
jgi:hypothetical protein